jgi:NADPH-dependent ferric siderophore reductase
VSPFDDPMDHNAPFDFFDLGQPANQGHPEQMAHPEVEQLDAQNWGQWLAGDAHAAPAAQVAHMQNMLQNNVLDLNIAAEVDNLNHMELDLNEAPEIELDLLDQEDNNLELDEEEQTSVVLSDENQAPLPSETLVHGNMIAAHDLNDQNFEA